MNTKQATPEREADLSEADYRFLEALAEEWIEDAMDRIYAEICGQYPWASRWLRRRKRRQKYPVSAPAPVQVGSSMPSAVPATATGEAPAAAAAGAGAVAAPTGGGMVAGT